MWLVLACFTLTFDSSPIKGEGEYGCFVLLSARPLTSGLRVKSAMTGLECPRCGYCLEASMSLRHGRIQQVLSVACPCHPVDCGSSAE